MLMEAADRMEQAAKCGDWGSFYRTLRSLVCWMEDKVPVNAQAHIPVQARAHMFSIGGDRMPSCRHQLEP